MGLSTPVGLFNLGSTTNLGSGGSLVNKGSVTFASGVTGTASEAAQFTGSTAQALYVLDTGAADPFRIATGSFGCWFRTAKRGTAQYVLSKYEAATHANRAYALNVNASNNLETNVSNGTTTANTPGVTDVADDRWHFGVGTFDGSTARLYVDGALEASVAQAGTMPASTDPFNIGGFLGDAATATSLPHFGRVDEAFVTADVLSLDQIRNLYAVKVPHTLATTPKSASVSVDRFRRGAVLASADFPTQPVRLHNLNNSLADLGSGATAVTLTGTSTVVAGPDGTTAGAYLFDGTTGYASSTDTGLPSGTSSRSMGIWFKGSNRVVAQTMMSYGSAGEARLYISAPASGGSVAFYDGTNFTQSSVLGDLDGQWHQLIVTIDNAAADGVKVKLYKDTALVAGGTALASTTLAGASGLRIGRAPAAGTDYFPGSLARAFVASYVLTPEQIQALYLKGSQQLLSSPKNAGDHIEGLDATYAYIIGDALQTQDRLNVSVMA
jgi:hypothetical protein